MDGHRANVWRARREAWAIDSPSSRRRTRPGNWRGLPGQYNNLFIYL